MNDPKLKPFLPKGYIPRELPKLTGSLSQVEWANRIREEALRQEPNNETLRYISTANAWIDRRKNWGF